MSFIDAFNRHTPTMVKRLGEQVLVSPSASNTTFQAKYINGIFENEYARVDFGVGIESSDPTMTCDEDDVLYVVHEDTFTVTRDGTSTVYTVKEREPTDDGLVRFQLETP